MKLYHSPTAPNPDRVIYFLRAKGKLDAVELALRLGKLSDRYV